MDNTDNSPKEEKAIKKKKEDDSNVILNMLVVNKKQSSRLVQVSKAQNLHGSEFTSSILPLRTLVIASKCRICHRASCW